MRMRIPEWRRRAARRNQLACDNLPHDRVELLVAAQLDIMKEYAVGAVRAIIADFAS